MITKPQHRGTGDFCPQDFRIYASDADGKTKRAHFRGMLLRAVADKRLQVRPFSSTPGMRPSTT